MIVPSEEARLAARRHDGRRPRVMYQRWESLLFLHWECDPGAVAARLPPGLHVDLFDGKAYLGIIPVRMRGVRPRGLPAVPGISGFLESNVRTYVHDGRGVPGVWFTSLECSQPLAVGTARRFFDLPYFNAAMRERRDGDRIDYRTRRRGAREEARFLYRPRGEAREAEPGTLDFFLVERYYLYAWNPARSRLRRGQVVHSPYLLRGADAETFSTLPARLDGFAPEGPPCHRRCAAGVSVAIHGLEEVS